MLVLRILGGLILTILFSIIPFLINPILGVLWVAWLIGVAIYTIKKNRGR